MEQQPWKDQLLRIQMVHRLDHQDLQLQASLWCTRLAAVGSAAHNHINHIHLVLSAAGIRLAGATNDVHIFDVRNGTWTKITPMGEPPSPRAAHAAAAVGNMVVVQVSNMYSMRCTCCRFRCCTCDGIGHFPHC